MFGTKKSSHKISTAAAKNIAKLKGVTVITAGCEFDGKLICRGSSRIAGKLTGELISDSLLIIEEEAEIEAKLTTEKVMIHGKISGSLYAKEKVEISSTGSFIGDIDTPSLVIQEGAEFDGRSISRKGKKTSKELSNEKDQQDLEKEKLSVL